MGAFTTYPQSRDACKSQHAVRVQCESVWTVMFFFSIPCAHRPCTTEEPLLLRRNRPRQNTPCVRDVVFWLQRHVSLWRRQISWWRTHVEEDRQRGWHPVMYDLHALLVDDEERTRVSFRACESGCYRRRMVDRLNLWLEPAQETFCRPGSCHRR